MDEPAEEKGCHQSVLPELIGIRLPFSIVEVSERWYSQCHDRVDFFVNAGNAGKGATAVLLYGTDDVSHVYLGNAQ